METINRKTNELVKWLPLLKQQCDYLSQRVIKHAVLCGFDLMVLSLTLEVEVEELESRWLEGRGFTDISESTRVSLAEFLDVPIWHLWFLSGELSLLDLFTESETRQLVNKAKSIWPELLAFKDDATALFALFLSGEELVPTTGIS